MFEDVIESSCICDINCNESFANNQDDESDYEYDNNRAAERNADEDNKNGHGGVSKSHNEDDIGQGLDENVGEECDLSFQVSSQSFRKLRKFDNFSNNSWTSPTEQHGVTVVNDDVWRNREPRMTSFHLGNNREAEEKTVSAENFKRTKYTLQETGNLEGILHLHKLGDNIESTKTDIKADTLEDNSKNNDTILTKKSAGANQEPSLSKISADNSYCSSKTLDSTIPDGYVNCATNYTYAYDGANHLLDTKEYGLVNTTIEYTENKHHVMNLNNTCRKAKDQTGAANLRLPSLVQDTNESNNKGRPGFETQPVRNDDHLTFPMIGPDNGSTHVSAVPPPMVRSVGYKSKYINEQTGIHLPPLETGAEWEGCNNHNNQVPVNSPIDSLDVNHNKYLASNILTSENIRLRESNRFGSLDRSDNNDIQKRRSLNIKERISIPTQRSLPFHVSSLLHKADTRLVNLPGLPGKKTGTNAFNIHAEYTRPMGTSQTIKLDTRDLRDEKQEIHESFADLSMSPMELSSKAALVTERINSFVMSEKVDVTTSESMDKQVRFSGSIPHYTIVFTVRDASLQDKRYLKVKYEKAKDMIRFELPLDLSLLKGKTPLFYLSQFLTLHQDVKASYGRIFKNFKGPNKNSKTVKENNLYRAINSLVADDFVYSNYELLDKFILKPERGIRPDEKIKLNINEFVGLLAFCERRFWSEFFPISHPDNPFGCCSFLEYLDFRHLDIKLMTQHEKLSPALIIVLKSLT